MQLAAATLYSIRVLIILAVIPFSTAPALAEAGRGPAEVQIKMTEDILVNKEWKGMWVNEEVGNADHLSMYIYHGAQTGTVSGRNYWKPFYRIVNVKISDDQNTMTVSASNFSKHVFELFIDRKIRVLILRGHFNDLEGKFLGYAYLFHEYSGKAPEIIPVAR